MLAVMLLAWISTSASTTNHHHPHTPTHPHWFPRPQARWASWVMMDAHIHICCVHCEVQFIKWYHLIKYNYPFSGRLLGWGTSSYPFKGPLLGKGIASCANLKFITNLINIQVLDGHKMFTAVAAVQKMLTIDCLELVCKICVHGVIYRLCICSL